MLRVDDELISRAFNVQKQRKGPSPARRLCAPSNPMLKPRGEALRRWLGLDEDMKVGPRDGISTLIKRGRDQHSLSTMWGYSKKVAIC